MNTEKNLNKCGKALCVGSVSSRLISEAILNDKQLQALHAERANIYSLATPTVVLKKDWCY